jgi:uncharacterized protein YegJ (DUF2314 family)
MRNFIVGIVLVAGAAGFGFFGAPSGSDKPMAIPPAAPGKSETAPRPVKENVVAYQVGDRSINGAREMARSTLPRFRELIAADTPGTYTVKFPLTQNGATEHIWMQLTDYRDGTFVGLLANDPVNGNKYKMGDRMEVAEADIEDWMINTGGEMYGGYTVRVILADMPEEEAAKYKAMFRD